MALKRSTPAPRSEACTMWGGVCLEGTIVPIARNKHYLEFLPSALSRTMSYVLPEGMDDRG